MLVRLVSKMVYLMVVAWAFLSVLELGNRMVYPLVA